MLKIKQLLCSAFITRDIMGSGTVGGGLFQAPDILATPLSIGGIIWVGALVCIMSCSISYSPRIPFRFCWWCKMFDRCETDKYFLLVFCLSL